MARAEKLDHVEIAKVIESAVEQGLSFQVNVHGLDSVETAIDLAEKILGWGKVQITQQPSCFVVSAEANRGNVAFFVSKK